VDRLRPDEAAVGQVADEGLVGRQENVERRALLDLLGQLSGCQIHR
jgi:hypothetical protein